MRSKRLGALLLVFCVLIGYIHFTPKYQIASRLPTVVEVRAEIEVKDAWGDPNYNYTTTIIGTGTIIRADGLILTAGHVLDDAVKVWVVLPGGIAYIPEYWEVDPNVDVGIVKIDCHYDLPISKLGNSNRLIQGEFVFTIGSSLGLRHSVSTGIISNLYRIVDYDNDNRGELNLIQFTAPSYPGNSGGPVFNRFGQLVGVVSGGAVGYDNFGLMTPINQVKEFIENVLLEKSTDSSRDCVGCEAR